MMFVRWCTVQLGVVGLGLDSVGDFDRMNLIEAFWSRR